MMMLGILLAMPLFAADTPATLDTLRDQIASLTTTVNAMNQKIDGLRLGGAVGDIGAVKDIVSNQGVQVVHFEIAGSIRSQDSEYPWTTTYDPCRHTVTMAPRLAVLRSGVSRWQKERGLSPLSFCFAAGCR